METQLLSQYKNFLTPYVGYQTVSSKKQRNPQGIRQNVNFLETKFKAAGMDTQVWRTRKLNPIIFADHTFDLSLPTVLIYGHYDVVSVKAEDWTTPPYVLTEVNDYLQGRGATDNKGQNAIHIVAVLELIKTGMLTCNVKFFLEGDEETGSVGMEEVIKKHKRDLKADYFLVSDGEMVGKIPVKELSLRGLANLRVTVTTAKAPAHSGLAGGIIHNAAVEAAKIMASLFDEDGDIAIPGFYDGMDLKLIEDPKTIANNEELLANINLKELYGVKVLKAGKPHQRPCYKNPFTRNGLMPALEVMGNDAGNASQGFTHIIPHEAVFGLNVRLVGTQKPAEMVSLIKRYLEHQAPSYVDLKIENYMAADPIMLTLSEAMSEHLNTLIEKAYGRKPLIKYCGAGIPVVAHIRDIVGAQPILVPLANDTCNMHGPDENIGLFWVKAGLEFSTSFFSTPFPS